MQTLLMGFGEEKCVCVCVCVWCTDANDEAGEVELLVEYVV